MNLFSYNIIIHDHNNNKLFLKGMVNNKYKYKHTKINIDIIFEKKIFFQRTMINFD